MFPGVPVLNDLANHIDSHIRTQNLGHCYAAVSILILFYDSRHYAAGSQTRSIQRVNKLKFLVLSTEFHIAAASLIIPCIRSGADLLINTHAGNPNFNVIGACHREGTVAGCQLAQAVMQAQLLYQTLCLASRALQKQHQIGRGGCTGPFPPY